MGRVVEMAASGDREEIARKEFNCEKKTSCVIWNYSKTLINPLPECE
jgi:hypothetical protein